MTAASSTSGREGPAPGRPRRVAELGGYRLVRRLDADAEVTTWLARGGDDTVVLRAFRPGVADERIDDEISARERLRGAHVPALLDVATAPAGLPVAVVQSVVGPLLDDVLASCTTIRAGHVTTILAPLAGLLEAAHESGAVIGRLDARAIRIDAAGSPVVVALGAAAVGAPLPERFRDREPGIVADRAALDALAARLVPLVDARERPAVEAALASGAGRPSGLELALFDCAAPLPLRELVDRAQRAEGRPAQGQRAAGEATESAAPLVDPSTGRRRTAFAVPARDEATSAILLDARGSELGLPAGLLAPVDRAIAGVRRAVDLARGAGWSPRARAERRARRPMGPPRSRGDRAATVRPRRGIVLVGAAGAAALVAALLIAGTEGDRDALGSAGSGTMREEAFVAAPAGEAPAPSPEASGAPVAVAAESLVDPTAEQWAPLVGLLVDRWLACAPSADATCTDAVAQPGSSASAALAAPDAGDSVTTATLAAWSVGDRGVVVIDRQGSAAVVELLVAETPTASLLVMRSEAGWRVRSVLPLGSG